MSNEAKNTLVELIRENPELEVKVLYFNNEDNGNCWALGDMTTSYIDQYVIIDEYFYLRSDDDGYDALCGEIGGDAIEKMSKDQYLLEVEKLGWKKVIIVEANAD